MIFALGVGAVVCAGLGFFVGRRNAVLDKGLVRASRAVQRDLHAENDALRRENEALRTDLVEKIKKHARADVSFPGDGLLVKLRLLPDLTITLNISGFPMVVQFGPSVKGKASAQPTVNRDHD